MSQKPLKKFKFYLQLYDAIWSFPLAVAAFIIVGLFLQSHFVSPSDGHSASGFYDPIFLQVAFYASCIQVFVNFTVWLGMYFNFRGLWRYIIGHVSTNGEVKNDSKSDFLNITSWQRLSLSLFVFCFLTVEYCILFSLLI